jgi:thiamine-phosphate pyrophosphorylase
MTRAGRLGSGIYLVTDTGLCGGRGVVETVRAAVAAGVRTVQVRDKGSSAAELYELVRGVADAVGADATVLVNDRVDVYLAARAGGAAVQGVHLGQGDLPVEQARRLVGPTAIIGLTANSDEHLRRLGELPANTVDYLGVGVIHPTSTKPDHPPAFGVDGFTAFAARSPLPCVAIGGVSLADIAPLRRAGAVAAAVVSAVCSAADAHASALSLVTAWDHR